jgi:uncharacterized protein YndB with AHSA1/START domain
VTGDDPRRTLTIVRRLSAPPEAVFRAWTDPVELGWFANRPPRTPTTVDLRVGGAWRLHMVESDERDYITGGVYRDIVPPERLVFTWGAVGGWPPLDPDDPDSGPVITVVLRELDDGTEMSFTLEFPHQFSDDDVRIWLGLGVAEGWTNTLDRLEPFLIRPSRERS